MNPKTRMWIFLVLAGIGALLTLLSAVWPTWFEALSGESPDGGDGSLERLLALVWLAGTVGFVLLARRSHRQLSRSA